MIRLSFDYSFKASEVIEECTKWIRDWFDENGEGCNAIIGISGGKDSSVVAALCARALGKDRVIGVIMPNIVQADIQDAIELTDFLGIRKFVIPITNQVYDAVQGLKFAGIEPSEQTMINLPPRVRMATLYAVSQSMNGRVANTCNLSENYVGYSTRYGDDAGDFSTLGRLTCTEVIALGHALQLPDHLVDKAPADGLCGKTDEESLGFTYDQLDRYIRNTKMNGGIDDDVKRVSDAIDHLHLKNQFKLRVFDKYDPSFHNLYLGEDKYERRYRRHAV